MYVEVKMDKKQYNNYLAILREELMPAMGCTEPIAIALAAAKAREVLGHMPEQMKATCSGNIVKNVKGVVVPNSGGQRGIRAAAVLGAVAGDASKGLEVIADAKEDDIARVKELCSQGFCDQALQEDEENLFIRIDVSAGDDTAAVEIRQNHDNISYIEKNGTVLLKKKPAEVSRIGDKSRLNMDDIIDFADEVDIDDIDDIISRQIEYNTRISDTGLKRPWGAGVGYTLMKEASHSTRMRARAAAAAGSDARMNGCSLPVIINSGSGNQGITCTMPVIVYAKELGIDPDRVKRALILTDLVTLHQKYYIGNLSAYCGAVSAGAAAGCGIAYLAGADRQVIKNTLINALDTTGGIVCDGAKASCASKVSSAVDAGITGYIMAKNGHVFPAGEGLVEKDCEQTIQNFGRVGRDGMKSTDIEILHIMLEK